MVKDDDDPVPRIEIDVEPTSANEGRPSHSLTMPHASVDWMRGFDEGDFAEVASIIVDGLQHEADVPALRGRAEALCEKRPLYPGSRGYTAYA